MSRSSIVVVFVMCPTRAVAQRLARELIQHRLAACVNVVPSVESFFWWKGKIERSPEALLLIKTPAAGFERLRRRIIALHPYDVPEVIALPVTTGHQPYLQWVSSSVKP